MSDEILQGLGTLIRVLEMISAGIFVVGFVIATAHCFLDSSRLGLVVGIERYRQAIGRVVLIGLEVLVATTILKTITLTPTVESMSFLVIMVAIRTTLGWTMVLEMNGRWPWQKARPDPATSHLTS